MKCTLMRSLQIAGVCSFATLAPAAHCFAGIGDSPTPTFSDGAPASVVLLVPGVINRPGIATTFFCSSVASAPVDIGVEVFSDTGALQNSVHSGVGAILSVAPGATVTFGSKSTAGFLEDAIIPLPGTFAQGSARVVASSPSVKCNVIVGADSVSPPTSLLTFGQGKHAASGTVPSSLALPQFSDGKTASSVVLFAGAVKRATLETAVLCTSLATSPIDVGVEVLSSGGIVANSIHSGNGAVLDVAPGQTVTFGTTGTAALLETSVITIPAIAQGIARVVSTSPELLCSAASLDSAVAPPASASELDGRASASAAAGPTLAAALPSFSDSKPGVHIATIPGALKRGSLQTVFLCSSFSSSALDIGVQIFDLDGTLQNDVSADVGAVLNVAPGGTATIATSATAAYLENTVIPLADGLQGVARIVASSPNVQCSAMIVDDTGSPPVSLATLGHGVQPTAGALPSTIALPMFSSGHQATHAALFPGAVKRGDVETDIFCTSLAAAPIDIGVQVLAPDGSVANSVPSGNGALLGVLPGHTVTFGTTGTAALLESQVITLSGIAQGMARVVSNSGQLLCSAMVLDAAATPPRTATALAGFAGGCGDGVLQSGEQCDGASDAACPGNCDAGCLCPASCGDGFVQSGEACDDGNLVSGDCCSTTCQLECDDGDPCTQDSCSVPGGACTHAETPLTSCFTAASSFQLKAGTTPEKQQLKWKWRNGPAISQGLLGNPGESTTYALCVYDTTGTVSSIATRLVLPPQPAWLDRDPGGWSYADPSAFFDGFVSVSLSTGTTGRSKAQIKAAGVNLPMPLPVSATKFFDEQPTVTVQLVQDATPLCWQSTFTAAAVNDGLRFKAKAP